MNITTDTPLAVTPLKKTPWFALPLIVSSIALVAYIFTNMQIVMTDSIDATVTWPSDKKPVLGDFVTFQLTHEVIPTSDNTVQVTKILSCNAGQHLENNKGKWTCDGKFIGNTRERAINGDELEQFIFNGIIPEGKAFLTGTHKHSFDSRYWGFVDIDSLATVTKVF